MARLQIEIMNNNAQETILSNAIEIDFRMQNVFYKVDQIIMLNGAF